MWMWGSSRARRAVIMLIAAFDAAYGTVAARDSMRSRSWKSANEPRPLLTFTTLGLLLFSSSAGWSRLWSWFSCEVDYDLAVHVPACLQLDGGADLVDGEGRGDRHSESALRGQTGDFLDGAGGGVGAVGRRDAVHSGGDRGHAGVRYAEFACHRDRVGAVQVHGRGDAVGSQLAESVGQALAVGYRLGSQCPQGVGRGGRSGPDDSRAGEASELDGEHADPAS